MAKEEKEKISIEEAFAKLDETVKEMEDDDVSLERSFSLYKTGMELIESCTKEIDLVEKSVLKLSKNGETDDFS